MKRKGGRPVGTTVAMCQYRKTGVECPLKDRDCEVCGWNPKVETNRIARLKK